jgi:hypothetical protein
VRWCYGGRRWSCGGEEGEEGELELHGRRMASGGGRATLTVEKLATAEARTAVHGTFGQGRVDTAGWGGGGAREAAVGGAGEHGEAAVGRSGMCCRDVALSQQRFNPHGQRGAWWPCGPGAARDG